MPFIHISALPRDEAPDIAPLLESLCQEFAATVGIDVEHVSATWTWLQPGHYAVGGRTAQQQPVDSHPLLVDLLAPDFNSARQVETMLVAIVDCLAAQGIAGRDNIFINHRAAASGRVYDGGEIVRW